MWTGSCTFVTCKCKYFYPKYSKYFSKPEQGREFTLQTCVAVYNLGRVRHQHQQTWLPNLREGRDEYQAPLREKRRQGTAVHSNVSVRERNEQRCEAHLPRGLMGTRELRHDGVSHLL